MRVLTLLLCSLVLSVSALAQTKDFGTTFKGPLDASTAPKTSPNRTGSGAPTNPCSGSETYQRTDAPEVYGCVGTQWKLLGGVADATALTYTSPRTGGVQRTAAAKLNELVSVKDFGGICDGAANDYTAIVAAMAALPNGGDILFPGYCRTNSTIVVTTPNLHFVVQAGALLKGANVTAIDVRADGFALHGRLIGNFSSFYSPSQWPTGLTAPGYTDTTSGLSVGVADTAMPREIDLEGAEFIAHGLDGVTWIDGPRGHGSFVARNNGRWGVWINEGIPLSSLGTPGRDPHHLRFDVHAYNNGSGQYSEGGGLYVGGAGHVLDKSKAYGNFGPGFKFHTGGTSAESLWDEMNAGNNLESVPLWAATTSYALGRFLIASGRLYQVTVAGISGSTAPTHSSGTAANGTVTLRYRGKSGIFVAQTEHDGALSFSTLFQSQPNDIEYETGVTADQTQPGIQKSLVSSYVNAPQQALVDTFSSPTAWLNAFNSLNGNGKGGIIWSTKHATSGNRAYFGYHQPDGTPEVLIGSPDALQVGLYASGKRYFYGSSDGTIVKFRNEGSAGWQTTSFQQAANQGTRSMLQFVDNSGTLMSAIDYQGNFTGKAGNTANVGSKSAAAVQAAVTAVEGASPTGAPYAVAVYDGNGILQSTAPQPFSDSTSATVHTFPNPFLTANVAVQDLTDLSGNVLLGCFKSATSLTITITCGIATGVKGNFIGSSNGGVQVQGNGSSFYQTVLANGTARTQRSALNFSGAFNVTDNNGSDRTEVDINQIPGAKVNGNIAGKAATADALAATPTLCPTGQAPTGILPNGNATGCAASSGSGASSVSQLTDLAMARASATTITIQPGGCGSANAPTIFTNVMTITISGSGSGLMRGFCDTSTSPATYVAQLSVSSGSLSHSCSGGCTAATGSAAPADAIVTGTATISTGSVDVAGVTNFRVLSAVPPPIHFIGVGLDEQISNGVRNTQIKGDAYPVVLRAKAASNAACVANTSWLADDGSGGYFLQLCVSSGVVKSAALN